MKKVLGRLLAIVLAVWALAPVFAQDDIPSVGKNAEQPIEITARQTIIRTVPGGTETTFEGNVKVLQGDLKLTCERLTLVHDKKDGNKTPENRLKKLPKQLQAASEIKSITASGNVRLDQGDRTARADKALFDNAKRTITLTGGPPRLWQGRDTVVAETIVIYLDEKRSEFKGGENGGIKAIITPGQDKEKKEK